MNSEYPKLEQFLQEWRGEFARSIERFTGQTASVNGGVLRPFNPTLAHADGALWWKQAFDGNGSFATWIGTPERTWKAIAGSAGGEDEARSMYMEMVTTAQQRAATVATQQTGKTIACQVGQNDAKPAGTALLLSEVSVGLQGKALSLMYVLDSAGEQVLAAAAVKHEIAVAAAAAAEAIPFTPMLERLLDLELPLSVVLGRTELAVQDILKLASGSLIELDRKTGDLVELLVHGSVVARGEVVAVKGTYAVRIKEIISRQERIAFAKNSHNAKQGGN